MPRDNRGERRKQRNSARPMVSYARETPCHSLERLGRPRTDRRNPTAHCCAKNIGAPRAQAAVDSIREIAGGHGLSLEATKCSARRRNAYRIADNDGAGQL